MENTTVSEVELPDLLDYAKAKIRIDKMIGHWESTFIPQAKKNQAARYVDFDVEMLRQRGDIEDDETFIPERIIDSNIRREKADAMLFLNSSHRLAYFRCLDEPTMDTRQLESDFSKGLTYPDWYKTFDKHYDGSALHGWAAIEVVYDINRTLAVGFEYIAHDKLYFNKDVENIQDSELVLRKYRVSVMRLLDFQSEHNFDGEQVHAITSTYHSERKDDDVITIYKVYSKINRCVYVSWYCKDVKASGWLKAPEKLRCGIVKKNLQMPLSIGAGLEDTLQNNSASPANIIPAPIPSFTEEDVREYPIFIYQYIEDEQDAITVHKGRGFLDMPQQEAVTCIVTSFVNGTMRASNIYAALGSDGDESGADVKQLDTPLEHGSIFNRPLEFFNMPYPDPIVLNSLQYLNSRNAEQTGKIATAVSNRKDSRKTAKELSLAAKEETKITSTNLANYSEFLRQVFTFAWKIVQAQALAGNIPLLLKPQSDPLTGAVRMINDTETISHNYDLRAAGDIDVIQKQQILQDMQQDWPVFQNTPLAGKFLEDYIRLRYPLKADEYIAIMKAGNPGKQIVQSLLAALNGALTPEELNALPPQSQQQVESIAQQATAYLQNPSI